MSTLVDKPPQETVDASRIGSLNPPRWVLIGLGVLYLAALMVLVFWPGGTLIERLRALVGGTCAQLDTHSFYPGGVQLPLCARCTGMYLGFAIGVIGLHVRGLGKAARMPRGWTALALLGFIAVMAVDGFNSLFVDLHLPHLYQPNNVLRLFTGMLTGTAMAAFLLTVVNGVLWRDPDLRPAYGSMRFLRGLAPALVIAFLAVLSQWGILLYPLALLSSAGVVLALTLINLTFVLAALGRVERFRTYAQVAPIFTVSLALAVTELIGLFLLKQSILAPVGI